MLTQIIDMQTNKVQSNKHKYEYRNTHTHTHAYAHAHTQYTAIGALEVAAGA